MGFQIDTQMGDRAGLRYNEHTYNKGFSTANTHAYIVKEREFGIVSVLPRLGQHFLGRVFGLFGMAPC